MMKAVASCLLLVASARAVSVPPGAAAGLYSDMVSKSDFTLNLQPPAETAADASDALSAVMKREEMKSKTAFANFAAQKQRLLEIEKKEVAKLVGDAFAAVASRSSSFLALEPAAALATQPDWQASEPIPVSVSFDVPAYGASDALAKLETAASVEAKLAQKSSAVAFTQTHSAAQSGATPNVEVSLAAPVKPLPEIAAGIGSLDAARESFEAGKMAEVTKAFNLALRSAKGKIGAIVGEAFASSGAKAVSMLQGVVSFKVNVLPGAAPDASVLSKIDAIEHKRSDMESAMFSAAAAEFESITDAIVSALKKELSSSSAKLRGAAFLSLPAEAFVKVVPSDTPYPTVASLATDMETRRDISEGLAMARILELDMKLIKAELAMIKSSVAEMSK